MTMTETDNATDNATEAASGEPPPMKWYAVHSYSGYEARVRESLAQRMAQYNLEDHFGEILIPSESTTETLSSGRTRTSRCG